MGLGHSRYSPQILQAEPPYALCSYVYFPVPLPAFALVFLPLCMNISSLLLEVFGPWLLRWPQHPFSLVGLWVREMVWSSWDFRCYLWGVYPLLPFEHSDLDLCCCARKRKGKGLRDSPVSKALALGDLI